MPKATFFRAVSQGKRDFCWKTIPLSVPGPFIGAPLIETCPLVASSRPIRTDSSVLFPQPEGPITLKNSPSSTQKLTPSSARSFLFWSSYYLMKADEPLSCSCHCLLLQFLLSTPVHRSLTVFHSSLSAISAEKKPSLNELSIICTGFI